tara:strand:- start:255 stop:425 length:171 start_codon:yes stop_codon:yes gene_type:complete
MVLVVAVEVVPVALVEMHLYLTMMVVQVVSVLDCHLLSMILEYLQVQEQDQQLVVV